MSLFLRSSKLAYTLLRLLPLLCLADANLAPGWNKTGRILFSNGFPYWHAECIDDETQHGYTVSGRQATCTELKENNYCATDENVNAACPLTCDTCPAALRRWAKPQDEKTYTINNNCLATQEAFIHNTTLTLKKICAATMYCLETKSELCQQSANTWFGGNASDTTNWDILRSGFIKICSTDFFSFNCAPQSCPINFVDPLDNQAYSYAEQLDVPDDQKERWINEPTAGAYSGMVAWSLPGGIAKKRINICPMMLWVQSHEAAAGYLINEFSSFVDVGATGAPETYDEAQMKADAQTTPWKYLRNGPTWNAFARDILSKNINITFDSLCTQSSCPTTVDGGWCAWSTCSSECDGGHANRSCSCPTPQLGGTHCNGSSSQYCFERNCTAAVRGNTTRPTIKSNGTAGIESEPKLGIWFPFVLFGVSCTGVLLFVAVMQLCQQRPRP